MVDAIQVELPSRLTVSLVPDGWISTSKMAIASVTADFIDHNWALRNVQLTFNDIESLFISYFQSQFRMIGQGSTTGSPGSDTCRGRS